VIGSSTRLVSDPTGVSSATLNDVPEGIVISCAAVAGGGVDAGAGAPLTGFARALPGVSARVWLQPTTITAAATTINSLSRIPSSIPGCRAKS
jgi:hypothetical protein